MAELRGGSTVGGSRILTQFDLSQDMTFGGAISPLTDLAQNLGTASLRWDTVYAEHIFVTGANAELVFQERDGAGNWVWYANAGVAYLYLGGTILSVVGSSGLLTTTGDIIGGGDLTIPGASIFGASGNTVEIQSDGDVVFNEGGGLGFGGMYSTDRSGSTAVDTSYNNLDVFDNDGPVNAGVTVNSANDTISCIDDGKYYISFSLSVENASGSDRDLEIAVFMNDITITHVQATGTLGTNTDNNKAVFAGSGLYDIAGDNQDFTVKARCDSSFQNFVFIDCHFDMIQVGGGA